MNIKLMTGVLFVLAAIVGTASISAQVLVIANPKAKAVEVSKSEVRDLFSGSSTSLRDGSLAAPILQKAGAAHEEFLAAFIAKSDSVFRASWRSLVFSGQGVMPKNLDSDAAVIDFVARTPGAIGYIGKASPHDGVKVLTVK